MFVTVVHCELSILSPVTLFLKAWKQAWENEEARTVMTQQRVHGFVMDGKVVAERVRLV